MLRRLPLLLLALSFTATVPAVAAAPAGAAVKRLPDQPVPLVELGTPAGASFYTLSPAEAERAVAANGFTRRSMHVAYVRATAFDGAQPLFRLKQAGRAAYLVTAAPSERDALVASRQFSDEGVIGYAAKDGGPGLERLWRFSNGSEWRLALERDRARLVGQGWRLDGPLGYVHARYIRAGAIYFGRYDDLATNVIEPGKRTYGRDGDWWSGVRDYHGTDVPPARGRWPGDDFSDWKPAIGWYDDADPRTLEQHIAQASSAGLSYFSFYWYWSSRTASEAVYKGLHSYLRARNRSQIDFGVQVCAHAWGGNLEIPRSQFAAAARTLADQYISQPGYVRANDGRPIVWICDTRGIGSGSTADVRAFTDALRARAGEDLLVIANRDLGGDLPASGIDGQYCTAAFETVGGSYRRYVGEQRTLFGASAPVFQRCIMSDFDERSRYPMSIADPAAVRYFTDRTTALFDQAIANVREDVAASSRPSTIDNFALIYAWNEWDEGGFVEPNVRDGCLALDRIRAGLELTGGSGCVARPPSLDPPAPAPVPGPGTTPAPAPRLGGLWLTNPRFAVKPRAKTAQRRAGGPPLGTVVRFRLDRRARVMLTLERKRTHAARTRTSKAVKKLATLLHRGKAGTNAIAFSGRVGRRALPRGRYMLRVQASAGGKRSTVRSARFRIVAR